LSKTPSVLGGGGHETAEREQPRRQGTDSDGIALELEVSDSPESGSRHE
jgi:hypothetical protein